MSTLVESGSSTIQATASTIHTMSCLSDEQVARIHKNGVRDLANEKSIAHLESCDACWHRYNKQIESGFPDYVPGYRIVEELGRGGASVVYAAWKGGDVRQLLALKVINLPSEEQRARFRREIAIHRTLDSPSIVKCLDDGDHGSLVYYSMELVRGEPLDQYVNNRPLHLKDKIELLARVARAIETAHAKGVAHRDLKPANILIDAEGEPHVLDFGLGTMRSDEWSLHVRQDQTRAGDVFGTVRYMSPEQAWGGLVGGAIDQRTDVWALGILLYDYATIGGYPYSLFPTEDRRGDDALLHRIRMDQPKPPQIVECDIKNDLAILIERCLVWEQERRIASAGILADELERCAVQQRIQTRRLPLHYRWGRVLTALALKHRTALAALSIVTSLVLISAFLFVANVQWRGPKQTVFVSNRPNEVKPIPVLTERDFVVVGVTEESLVAVPELGKVLGFDGVSSDLPTWRGLYGRLMERLALAKPLAVAWDFYMPGERLGDEAFARGLLALDATGVPVVIASKEFDEKGQPRISPVIAQHVGNALNCGSITVRDPILRPGEFVLAFRRGEYVVPSMAVAVVAGLRCPGRRAVIEWPERSRQFTVLYQERGREDSVLPARDTIDLTSSYRDTIGNAVSQKDDRQAWRSFEMRHPTVWKQCVVSIESLLRADDAEIAARCAGKVVMFGDLRKGKQFDLHEVRFKTEIVPDVPGCFVMCEAIAGVTAQSLATRVFPLTGWPFFGAALLSVIAAVIPTLPFVGASLREKRTRLVVGIVLCVALVTSLTVMTLSVDKGAVHAGLFVASAMLAAIFMVKIESSRQRYCVSE